ncbi:hypothetical protein BLNAU_4898 [Blattamonas nauphoetae]|uniref:Uncharacterized protein n=1 Tax=Blattamonas nauphoetae TaxID=2049346 RepID=A0ABQ9XE56_9EUKA|nr:hypothetical protein BLNAU_14280 [Blattamonas nauphoetae]KAK2953844.1 hypothetical protein BLNAU_11247 [Blattamonas nauphoetae]KAK2960015.1 hypothetical protein BLNAU_4898 [Blattamonas nauphoetae]
MYSLLKRNQLKDKTTTHLTHTQLRHHFIFRIQNHRHPHRVGPTAIAVVSSFQPSGFASQTHLESDIIPNRLANKQNTADSHPRFIEADAPQHVQPQTLVLHEAADF